MIPIAILGIIIAAVGGFFFYSKIAEAAISPYEAWGKWSMENNWNFYGNEGDYKMLLVGQIERRDIHISSVRFESIVDDPRDETELKIIMRQALPEGLRIHPFAGIDKKIKELPLTPIATGNDKLDKDLYIAATDVPTAKWLLSFGPVQEVLRIMIEEHLTSRIEGRSVYLRREGLSTNPFRSMIDKSTFIATVIDDHLMLAWKQIAQRFDFDPPVIDNNGLPRMQGEIQGFPIRISVNRLQKIVLSIRIDLSKSCPKDIEICGRESEVLLINPIEQFEDTQKIAQLGMNQDSIKSQQTFQAFRDPTLHDKIRSFFSRYPNATLTNSRFRFQVAGRNDSMLEYFINESISLAEIIHQCFHQLVPPPPPSIIDD